MSELAVPLVAVTVLDASATEVGLLSAVVWLPNLAGPASSVRGSTGARASDRLLVGSDLARAVVVLTVPAAALLDVLTLAQLFVVAALLGAWSTLFRSAWQPFFVALVRRDQYVEANGLMSATRSGSFIVGPALGGGLVQLLTAPFALVVDGLSFLLSALLLRRVDVAEPPPVATDDGRPLRTRLAEGMRPRGPPPRPRARPAQRGVGQPLHDHGQRPARRLRGRDLGLGAATIGIALGVGSGGALLGAVTAGRVARRIGTGRTIALGTLLFTAPMALVPLASGSTLAKAAVLAGVEAVSGFGVMLLDVNLNAVMAAVIPDDVRARVQGAFTTVNYGVRPLGAAARRRPRGHRRHRARPSSSAASAARSGCCGCCARRSSRSGRSTTSPTRTTSWRGDLGRRRHRLVERHDGGAAQTDVVLHAIRAPSTCRPPAPPRSCQVLKPDIRERLRSPG